MSNRQLRALTNNRLGLRVKAQGFALPMTRTETILRAEPGTRGFLDQVINIKSGCLTAFARANPITSFLYHVPIVNVQRTSNVTDKNPFKGRAR